MNKQENFYIAMAVNMNRKNSKNNLVVKYNYKFNEYQWMEKMLINLPKKSSVCLRADLYQKWAGKARVDPRDLTAIQVPWLAGKNTWLTIHYTKKLLFI